MPNYHYECANPDCELAKGFDFVQKMSDAALTNCLYCGSEVYRVLLPANLNMPTGDSDLKGKGFAKLVRRDKGVYENVTAFENESRYYHFDQPETMPDIKKRIED